MKIRKRKLVETARAYIRQIWRVRQKIDPDEHLEWSDFIKGWLLARGVYLYEIQNTNIVDALTYGALPTFDETDPINEEHLQNVCKALDIFDKYERRDEDFGTSDLEVYWVRIDPDKVSAKDTKRLAKLGFNVMRNSRCFSLADPDTHS